MSAHDNGSRTSIGKATRRGLKRNYDEISKAVFVLLLIHAAIAAPLVFCKSMGGIIPDIAAAGISLAVCIFGLIPLRFWGRQKIRRAFYRHTTQDKKHSSAYSRWLSTGLLRYTRGILWGLPFIACMVYLTVFRSILDATTFEMPVHRLALWLAGNPESGTGNVNLAVTLIAVAIALFGLLFAYGWWRDMPFEYLPVRSIGAIKTLHWSRRILKKNWKKMMGCTFVNFLLSLPAIIGFGAVLGMYAMKNVNFSYGIMMTITQLRKLFTQPIPQLVLLELLAVFAVLYLPLCIYRKCRNAALMAKAIGGRSHSGENGQELKFMETTFVPAKAEKQPEKQLEEQPQEQQEKEPEQTKETEA
ncbi:MAG: hypothetical protein IKH57_21990 [Clostridia bacterium]|nr:hypothetical protein [Clostridia bacterium]